MSSKIPNGERGAIEALITAKQSGRKIVPFLGAGISAGSGFPLVEAIRVYLLKVRYFIQYGAYRNALGLPDDSTTPITDPEQNPSRYLTDFGWPNPNQLNSDLYRITAFRPQEKAINTPFAKIVAWKGLLNDPAVVAAQTKLKAKDLSFAMRQAATISKETHWIDCHVAKVFSALLDAPPTLPIATPLANELSRFVRYLQTTRKSNARWGRRRWRLSSSALFAQLEDIRLYDRRLAEAIEEKVWSLDLAPTTDWARHLMQLSEGNLNLIDALFSMLGLRYAPGLSHRMMAQLVKGLNLPLLLTINFDPYLEQALQEEGISPRVLDVSRDDDPPDVAVVKQALSIIKLHGSSHSIRLGERLDYALDDDTRSRVANFVGDDALLLVVGFSGYERRMMQLIDHLATGPSLSKQSRVLWMHFEPEDELPGTLKDFQRRLRDIGRGELLQTARLADAGEFLFHFYQRAMDSYPRVRVPVTILPKRIIDLPRQEEVTELSVQHPERFEANARILEEIP